MSHHTIRMLLVGVLVLLCLTPLFAGAKSDALAKDAVTGLTADQAVKLGLQKYTDLYWKKTKDDSTPGICDGFDRFRRLRRYVNDRAVVKRTKAQQQAIEEARALCAEIGAAYVSVDEAACGGGTIHQVDYASEMAEVEIYVGKLILAMEKPKTSAPGRAAATKTLASLIAGLGKLPGPYTDMPEYAQQWKELHHEAITKLRTALPKLRHLIATVPDNGASALARFAREASQAVDDSSHNSPR